MENQDKKPTEPENTGEGDKSETLTKIEQANAAAERMEKANEVAKKENDRKEEIESNKVLDGNADAAQPEAEKEKMSDSDYADKVMNNERPDEE